MRWRFGPLCVILISNETRSFERGALGEVVPDTENVLAVSRLFGVSTDYNQIT